MNFTEAYFNDFTTPLGREWTLYNGVPACCPTSKWDRGNVRVDTSGTGELQLRGLRQPGTDTFHTAGASLAKIDNRLYGRWRMRARFDQGVGLKMCALLWPQHGTQPPEIDWAESNTNDANRQKMTATLHYPPTRGDEIHHNVAIDFSQWHEWNVRWTPGMIEYKVDGKVWGTDVDTSDKIIVPTTPMHFGVQTTMGEVSKAKPDSTTPDEVTLHIDWIKIWSYS